MRVFHRPFKGMWYYEMQVGPIVFLYKHDQTHRGQRRRGKIAFWRFAIWYDFYWWQYNKPRFMRRRKS